MPRNVDPGSIRVGKGLAPEGTVEDNSIRYPERDVDPLRVHIHDPSRAHMASSIGIVDEGDCYVSDEVEGALQEICGGASAGRLNGLISGGTFDELGNIANGSGPVTTTTLTLVNPTEIMMGAGVYDASGLVADLSGLGAGDYYVYFDTDSASPTFRTLLVSGTAPEVETGAGIEDVLLAKVSYDGADVTEWQDGRFFVRNLDRKVQYSSRQGENVDAWSEGCFATLQAFFLWMSEYGEGTGSPSEEEKGTVIIRGSHQFTVPLVVPTDHLQFVGDGNAVLGAANGFTGNFLVDITGRSDLLFRNITFQTSTSTLIGLHAGGDPTLSRIRVEDCVFDDGGASKFVTAIDLTTPARTGFDIRVSGSSFTVGLRAIRFDGLGRVHITDCNMVGPGAPTPNSSVVETGHLSVGCTDLTISRCSAVQFDKGFVLNSVEKVRVTDNSLSDVAFGIESVSGTGGALLCAALTVTGNTIDLDSAQGVTGINFREVTSAVIESNSIRGTHSAPAIPYGITVDTVPAGPGLGGAPIDLRIIGNSITDFLDTTFQGAGIRLLGDPVNPLSGSVVTGNVVSECGVIVEGQVSDFVISDNVLDGLIAGANSNVVPTSSAVRFKPDTATPTCSSRGTISGNQIRRFGDGILVQGTPTVLCTAIKVVDNTISEIIHTQDNRTDTFDGIGTKAIGLDMCTDCDIRGNTISDVGLAKDNSGAPIVFVGNVWSIGFYVRDSTGRVSTEGNRFGGSTSLGVGDLVGIFYAVGTPTVTTYKGVDHRIRDNSLVMQDPNDACFAGILFNIGDDKQPHAFNGAVVAGNAISSAQLNQYPQYGVLFGAFDFGNGVARGGAYAGIQVLDNTVRSFTRAGIAFDLEAGLNQTRECLMQNIVVSRNSMNAVAPLAGFDQAGIWFNTQALIQPSTMDGIEVSDNDINLNQPPSAARFNYGINVTSLRSGSTAACRRVVITDNRIPEVKDGTGVQFARSGDHDTDLNHDWSISRNRIGVGGSRVADVAVPETGIALALGESPLMGLQIHDNEIITPSTSTHVTVNSNTLGGGGEGHFDWSICDNRCDVAYGPVPLSGTACFNLTLVDTSLLNFQCAGNTFTQTSALSTSHGLRLTMQNTTAAPFTLRNVNVASNLCAGCGIQFNLEGISASQVAVTDNNVTGGSGGPTGSFLTSPLHFNVSQGSGTTPALSDVTGISVVGNTVLRGTAGIWFNMEDVASQSNVRVAENVLSNQRAYGALTPTGYSINYVIEDTASGTGSATNIAIEDNTIHETENNINFRFACQPDQISVRGLSISGNRFTQHGGCDVFVRMIPTGASLVASRYVNVKVDNNTITGLSETEYPVNGLRFEISDDISDVTHDIHNVSVSENQIDVAFDADSSTHALWARFSQLNATPMFVRGLNVDGNRITVFRDPDGGVPQFCSALEVELTSNAQNVSVSENQIDYQDEGTTGGVLTPLDYGLRLYHSFTTNEARPDANINTRYLVGQDLSGIIAPSARWDFWYNIDGVGGERRFLAVRWDSVRVSNNNIRFPAGGANTDSAALSIAPGQVSGQNVVTVCMWGFTMSGNAVRSCKQNYQPVTPGDPYLGNDAALVGHWNIVTNYDTEWPGNSTTTVNPNVVQSGWSITGNSVTDFARLDLPSTFAGHDVRVIGRDSGAPIAWTEGVVTGNITKDDGQAAIEALNGDGFDRYNNAGLQPNSNREGTPRTY
jgi:hypothetical protein